MVLFVEARCNPVLKALYTAFDGTVVTGHDMSTFQPVCVQSKGGLFSAQHR